MGDYAGIIVAIITSLASLAGVIITVNAQSKKFEEQMKTVFKKLDRLESHGNDGK